MKFIHLQKYYNIYIYIVLKIILTLMEYITKNMKMKNGCFYLYTILLFLYI